MASMVQFDSRVKTQDQVSASTQDTGLTFGYVILAIFMIYIYIYIYNLNIFV